MSQHQHPGDDGQSAPASPTEGAQRARLSNNEEPGFELRGLNLFLWVGQNNRGEYEDWRTFLTTLILKSSWQEVTAYDEDPLQNIPSSRADLHESATLVARFSSSRKFKSEEEVERREKVAKEILEAMGFEEKRRSASFLEIKWQKELPIDIAMLLVAGKEFWERFEKPTASEAVAQATTELELESASVAGEEGEKLGPASLHHPSSTTTWPTLKEYSLLSTSLSSSSTTTTSSSPSSSPSTESLTPKTISISIRNFNRIDRATWDRWDAFWAKVRQSERWRTEAGYTITRNDGGETYRLTHFAKCASPEEAAAKAKGALEILLKVGGFCRATSKMEIDE
ncbi:hypothetical protein B0T09DRAFT_392840 [Sordaria sp. MPI-SDFR-AT-0083]|nr:hypothetical protein B0T09DRAFT_392840 [Sordaria sp. MPI-SDFR-AT-0083]